MLFRKNPRHKEEGKKKGPPEKAGRKKAGESAPGRKGGKTPGTEGSGQGSMIIHGLDFRKLPAVSQGDGGIQGQMVIENNGICV